MTDHLIDYVALIPIETSNIQPGQSVAAAGGSQETVADTQQNFQEPQPKTAKDSDNNDWIKYAHSALVSDQDVSNLKLLSVYVTFVRLSYKQD